MSNKADSSSLHDRVRPDIDAYEKQRVIVRDKIRWRIPTFISVAVVAIIAAAWTTSELIIPGTGWFSDIHLIIYAGGIFFIFMAFRLALKPATDLQQSLRNRIIPLICNFVNGLNYRRDVTPSTFSRLPRRLVGTFNRQSFDDIISGQFGNFGFELYEASLSYKAGKGSTPIFQGLIVAFEIREPCNGVFIAARRTNGLSNFFQNLMNGSGLDEVDGTHTGLSAKYNFFSDNKEFAQRILTPELPNILSKNALPFAEDNCYFSFSGHDGFLLLPTKKNFFELPDLSTPLDYELHISPIANDLRDILIFASNLQILPGQKDAK